MWNLTVAQVYLSAVILQKKRKHNYTLAEVYRKEQSMFDCQILVDLSYFVLLQLEINVEHEAYIYLIIILTASFFFVCSFVFLCFYCIIFHIPWYDLHN